MCQPATGCWSSTSSASTSRPASPRKQLANLLVQLTEPPLPGIAALSLSRQLLLQVLAALALAGQPQLCRPQPRAQLPVLSLQRRVREAGLAQPVVPSAAGVLVLGLLVLLSAPLAL